jgi:hypothetical protein
MDNESRIPGTTALAWAAITLLAFVLTVASSSARGFDVYDITQGVRAISEGSILLFGAHIAFAWSGAALVFLVVAIHGWLPAGSQSYLTQAGSAFGLIAAALFLIYGLLGGHGYLDLSYVQSVRSAEYITDAYLPLSLVLNRTLAAAITISGLWLALTNWRLLRANIFSPYVAYLGLGAGVIALLGFVMPGGGFSLLSLLLAVPWAILLGLQLLRRRTLVASGSLS